MTPLALIRGEELGNLVRYRKESWGEREDVIWVGNGDVERLDVVPASKLPLLEGQAFPFTRPSLETRGLGGLVEPALVSGIVAGLIYLFYTNQN